MSEETGTPDKKRKWLPDDDVGRFCLFAGIGLALLWLTGGTLQVFGFSL